ncbi:hypothetical protein [Enterocloster citroniae]
MIKAICLQHPFVDSFFYGIYRAIDTENISYAAIILTPLPVIPRANTATYSFNMMYVDRLTVDRSNLIQVQSVGIDVIRGIASVISESQEVADFTDNISINVFDGQFADDVAGAVASIEIELPSNIGNCTWYEYCDPCKC